jgi:hypothetical protein
MSDPDPFPNSFLETVNMNHVDNIVAQIPSTRNLSRKITLINSLFAKLVNDIHLFSIIPN